MNKRLALGADMGWVSQLEAREIGWVDNNKNGIDPLLAVKNMGCNAVRLRVFVNPPREAYWQKPSGVICMLGFSDAKSVLQMSRRVKEMGMDLMIDFHYSDHFADPQYQHIPQTWITEDDAGLEKRVYQHTKDVLQLLKDDDMTPKWVQVGNEIDPGILHPNGSFKEHPDTMVRFLNAGYEAVKECFPKCQVITHVNGMHMQEKCIKFFDTFFRLGGKTDILGFSHYPYWFNLPIDTSLLSENLTVYVEKYQKPIMVCEVGGAENEEEETYQLLCNTIEAVQNIPENAGLGVFYWEPEVGAALLPDGYPLGAARMVGDRTLQFTNALTAYQKYSMEEP